MKPRLFTIALALLLAPALRAVPPPGLVEANFQPVTDSLGFIWDLDSNGSINQGSSIFSSVFSVELNGSSISYQQSMMAPDASEFFLTGKSNRLDVSRRIKIDQKIGFVRYFDTITNNSGAPQTLRYAVLINFNNQMQGAITDSGSVLTNAFGPKDTGFIVMPGQNARGPSAIFLLAGRGAKVRPTIQNQQNYRFTATYNLKFAAGETISLAYAGGQRAVTTQPDGKAIAKLLAPLVSPRLLAEIPARDRKQLANFAPGVFSGNATAPAIASFLDGLGVERGPTDVLAIGDTTRLKGVASCARLEIETPRGKATVQFEDIAAVQGGRREARVLLRDGQALAGKLSATGLKFALSTGTTIPLEAAQLDRLVMRTIPGEAQLAAPWGFVETFEGDRLAVKPNPALKLRATTAWGVREVTADELVACGPTEETPFGFQVLLKDGSHFVAFLDGDEIAFDTTLFGKKNFKVSEIRQIAVTQPKETDDLGEAPERAKVVLAGGQIFSGQIDVAELHFLSPSGVIPVAANLLRTLRNTSDDATASTPVFIAEVWGGGSIAGTLREAIVPVRSGGSVFQVPVRDLVDAVVPSPAMPERLRDKISALIRELAHPDWEKREAASRELGELGAMTHKQLEEIAKQTTDAEVRRRAQALLDAVR